MRRGKNWWLVYVAAGLFFLSLFVLYSAVTRQRSIPWAIIDRARDWAFPDAERPRPDSPRKYAIKQLANALAAYQIENKAMLYDARGSEYALYKLTEYLPATAFSCSGCDAPPPIIDPVAGRVKGAHYIYANDPSIGPYDSAYWTTPIIWERYVTNNGRYVCRGNWLCAWERGSDTISPPAQSGQ